MPIIKSTQEVDAMKETCIPAYRQIDSMAMESPLQVSQALANIFVVDCESKTRNYWQMWAGRVEMEP